MLKNLKKSSVFSSNSGQSAVEYMLVFAAVVVIAVLALAPNGFLTKGIEKTLDMPFTLLEDMAENEYYNLNEVLF